MSKNLVAAFRDLTDRKDVVFHGPGSFNIGLSTDGSVVVEPEDNAAAVCVVLLELNVSPSGGYVLSPANYDLPCVVNDSEELTREINLIDGTRLEVANKTMVFIDGPIPVRRRKLPRTPGMPLEDGAPAKPSRAQTPEKTPSEVTEQNHVGGSSVGSHQEANDDYDGDKDDSDNDDDGNDRRWLETSWCMLDMPTSEQQLFTDLKTPEQISIVAASYFCKQLRLFTDANVTTQLLDDIFKLFKDSITTGTCRDIFLDYLSQISKIIQKNPRRSQTRPMHRPAIKLLNGLIKQSVDSLARVILLLDLLRTFSHFDSNLITMAHHQVAATVLGCMSMYCDVVEVQCYGLDTLAKIAKFKPVIDVKAPLREAAVEIILKSETKHHKNLNICRSLCRVLANLSASLIDVTNTLLDTEAATNKAVVEAIDRYEECLLFMFKHSLPVVQTILDDHGTDLGVHTEGRRFVYFYAKLPQLQQKKKAWLQTLSEEEEEEVETTIVIKDEPDTSTPAIHDLLAYPESEQEPKGILKKAGSFEELREPGRRIVFADTTEGGSASDTSSSEDEMFGGSPFPENNIPTQIEAEDDFTFETVKALIANTLGSPKHNSSDSSDSSDDELLTTKIVRPKPKKPINRIAQKPDKNIDTQMLNNQLDSHKHVTQTERNSEELQFVENHYDRNSFSSDAHQTDILDNIDVLADCDQLDAQNNTEKIVSSENKENCNSGNTSALNENLAVNTYYRNGNSSRNGLQELTVSSIPHAPKQYDASQSLDRIQHKYISVNYNTMANGSEDMKVFVDQDEIATINLIEVGHQAVCSEALIPENNEIRPNTSVKVSVLCDNKILSSGSVTDSQEPTKEPCDVAEPNKGHEAQRTETVLSNYSRTLDSSVLDVPFMGKLVRTQIITHVGSLVFQGDDSKVLMVIDEPIVELLEHATAPAGLVEFANSQYGKNMTLMDLEPSIVISAIDAVRYRSVTAELVQKAVLSLTRAITHKLQPSTVNITMLFYKTLFSDENVKTIVTEKTFVQEFKVCFSNATQRLQTSHSIEEIRTTLSSPSFIV